MFKKFLSAIILVFAFLFLNVGEVKAVENTSGLPDEVFANAGIGEKMGYWAVVNYGDKYIDSDNIVIDIDKNAISNLDIQYIMIEETEYTSVGEKVYYKRNEDKEFSSKINYTLKNKFIGEKSVAILLLTELTNEPTEEIIIDKIIVPISHKRPISSIKDSDIIISQELGPNKSYSSVKIGLSDSVKNDYVIKNITYRFTKDAVALNAEKFEENYFGFNAYQNGSYVLVIEDFFGGDPKIITIEVTGIEPLPIVIEAIPLVEEPTNTGYDVIVNLYRIQGEDRVALYYEDLGVNDILEYSFNKQQPTVSIKEQLKDGEFYFNVQENGTYSLRAVINGSEVVLNVIISNIDKENPFMQVANNLKVYTESIDLFVPENEVFVYDNVSSGEYLMETLEIKYYYYDENNERVELSDYYDHLYSVREMYISYTVTDEAGNETTMECVVTPIDDTKPTISHSSRKMILYINDIIANVEGTNRRIETFFNLVVEDNSLYPGSDRKTSYTKTWDLATITDVNGAIRVSELTKNGRIFVVAKDEAGNESDVIVLPVEVCERLIMIEAKKYQFAVYGEYSPATNPILYHCIDVLRDEDGNEIYDEYGDTIPAYVDCQTLLLEGDKLIGSLYIEEAKYVGKYEIKYDKINVPSKLYSLDYGEEYEYIKFEIIPIKLKVIAKDRGKLYLDKDPDFSKPEESYYIDNTVCGLSKEEEQARYEAYYENLLELYPDIDLTDELFYGDIYRCKELEGDKLKGNLVRWQGTIEELIDEGYEGYDDVYAYEVEDVGENELVWYLLDENGEEIVVSRPIRDPGQEDGGLYVDEGDKSLDNYIIEYIEGSFTIYSKSVDIQIKDKEKIYGENDPAFDIEECKIAVYVGEVNDTDDKKDGYMYVEDCFKELGLVLYRDEGQTVFDGPYEIKGDWSNRNYFVLFENGYLTINERQINIEIKGDDGTPGRYTITYEDDLPAIVVVDSTMEEPAKGLVTIDRNIYGIDDKFNLPLEFVIYDSEGFELEYKYDDNGKLVPDYAADNTYYIRLREDRTVILDKDGNDSDDNYIINYNEGTIFVVKKDIHIKVKEIVETKKLLEKIYGDDDAVYSEADLESMFPDQKYIILDSNNNFFIEIASNTTLDNGEIYIPRDNKTMEYYLMREHRDDLQGIYVGVYPISIEYLDGCDNYNVYLNGNPVYEIKRREMKIIIGNQTIVYKDDTPLGDFTYDEEVAKRSLQYNDENKEPYREDHLVGKPNVINEMNCYVGVHPGGDLEYCNVGQYFIGQGSITVKDIDGQDVGFNYDFNVTVGSINVIKRTITIKSLVAEKKYGEFDPVFEYVVIHDGKEEDCDQLEGALYRESLYDAVEIPRLNPDGSVYEYPLLYLDNEGKQTLRVKPKTNPDGSKVYNYEIIEWDLERGLKIHKRNITIIPNSAEVYYGDNYSESIYFRTEGDDPAYNMMIVVGEDIDGKAITLADHIEGELLITNGPINGAGTFTISCENVKLVRKINLETIDVSSYYNITREIGTLIVKERVLDISIKDGLTKVYGELDPDWSNLDSLITVTCGNVKKCLVEGTHKIVGKIIRKPNFNAAGNLVMEDVGVYELSIEDLRVIDTSIDDPELQVSTGYLLLPVGEPTFIITQRELIVTADWQNIQYVESIDEIVLTYTEGGEHGRAKNDKLEGKLTLSPEYSGCGVYHDDLYKTSETICASYAIVKGTLTLENEHNYKPNWFIPGVMLVSKRLITVTLDESLLYKVYGTADPEFRFKLDYPASYTGELVREPGEDRGQYKILKDRLDFGDNYIVSMKDYSFTITPRSLRMEVKEGLGKVHLDDDPLWCELDKLVNIYGTILETDTLSGCLKRQTGESVGIYQISNDNIEVKSPNGRKDNYTIDVIGGVFEIYYVPVTELIINPISNNKYQVYNETTQVEVEAVFNKGANPALLNDVVWTVVKRLNNGDVSDFNFVRNVTTNRVTFLPTGDIGTYVVTAIYNEFIATYEVLVEMSTVRNVYIQLVQDLSGKGTQILGLEEWMVYSYTVTGELRDTNVVRWYVNDKLMKESKALDFEYFSFKPNGKGTYEIYAQIVNKASEPLYIYVENNNAPIIKLKGDPVIYKEVNSGDVYIDAGYEVTDDITTNEWLEQHRIPPTGIDEIDLTKIGTYYIRYDAVDEHGNYAISVYRQVVVRDTTAPVVELNKCPDGNIDMILLFGEPYIECGATAKDNYDGEGLKIYVNNQINMSRIGKYEVVYTAYDSSGNRGIAVRKVEIIDNISPRITLIGNERMYVEVYHEFEDPGANVHDNVDGDFIIYATTFYYGDQKVSSIDTSVLGVYYAHYDYTDSVGNIGATQIRIVEVRDRTPPVITLIGRNPYVIRYSGTNLEYEEPGAIVTDNYDENIEYTITGEIGHELGTYYLYYNAIDSSKNRAVTVIRQVVVIDVRNPILTFDNEAMCPQYMTLEALYDTYDKRCDMAGFGIYIDDDYNEDKAELQKRLIVTGSVDTTTVGTYVISYDVVDMAGNAAVTLNRYVKVVDTTAPEITLIGGGENGDQIVEVFEDYIEFGAIITDRYDDYHEIEIKTSIVKNVNANKLGEYQVIYTATDSNGNRATPVVRKVFVKDTKPPVITLNGESYITIERGIEYVEYGATVIDNYDGPIAVYTITNAPSGMILGTYYVTYRAIDSSGNIGEAIRTVKVDDTIPPIVLGVENGAYYKNPVSIYFVPTIGTNEVLKGWLNGKEITSPWFVEEEGMYDLHVEDDAGNYVDIWFAIDITPPEILGVKDGEYTNKDVVEIYSNEKIKYYEYRYQSGDWIRSEDQTLRFEREGLYRVYAVDMADNVSKTIMFVIDKTPPIYTLTGVVDKGITFTNVGLVVEENATIVVNALYNIDNNFNFNKDGYYQVAIRDLANNVVNLQFVINSGKRVVVDNKEIDIIDQYNAINKVSITGSYSRNSGYMIAKPLLEGGFEYVSGKLFSEAEYQDLLAGKTLEYKVSPTDDTYMFVAFIVESDELNKFGSQTVDGDKEEGEDEEDKDDNNLIYILLFLSLAFIGGGFFMFFLKRRRREEEDEDDEEIIVDDY